MDKVYNIIWDKSDPSNICGVFNINGLDYNISIKIEQIDNKLVLKFECKWDVDVKTNQGVNNDIKAFATIKKAIYNTLLDSQPDVFLFISNNMIKRHIYKVICNKLPENYNYVTDTIALQQKYQTDNISFECVRM